MRVVIAYDGSAGADAAIEGLPRAGLPKTAEIMVLSVANIYETSIPVPSELRAFKPLVSARIFTKAVVSARAEKLRLIAKTRPISQQGAAKARAVLPGVKVRSRAVAGDPPVEVQRFADEWDADLIVVGSNARSALGRFFLGSVSKTAAETAGRSVRIGRPASPVPSRAHTRVVAGSTNLAGVEALARELAKREWPAGTAVRVVSVDDGQAVGRVSSAYSGAKAIIEQAVEPLAAAGVAASAAVEKGELGAVLADEANDFSADTIILYCEPDGTPPGSITESEYTVEIIRPKQKT
jgi:nucleotide-binding universal stress UspA family protein